MDISELKNMKKQSSLTNQEIADLSGIPVSTINKIFQELPKIPDMLRFLLSSRCWLQRKKFLLFMMN